MKKFTTTVKNSKGENKTISVWLDDETVQALEASGNEELIRQYVIEEYKAALIERRETRRHQSLEKSMDNGFDIADENTDVEEETIEEINAELLHKAIEQLEPQQQWLIKQVYFLRRTKTSVAKEMGIDESSVRERIKVILKKLKNFLN